MRIDAGLQQTVFFHLRQSKADDLFCDRLSKLNAQGSNDLLNAFGSVAMRPYRGRNLVQAKGLVTAFVIDKRFVADLLNREIVLETAGQIDLAH